MTYNTIFLITILAIFAFGCSSAETPGNTANTNQLNKTADNQSSNNPLETAKTPEATTTNNAPTLTPVVKTYCEAIVKKDEAKLRSVFSRETIKQYEADMKADGVKTLVEFFAGTEAPDNKLCEARNEKIEGETAVAEVRTDNIPNGVKYKFIKENNEWKLTNESPDFNSVKQSAK